MNIKEIEDLSGLPRANVRYYEKEGLLAPGRQQNGTRIYDEKDLKVLLKIKLLRQLEVSLEDIRCLQKGEADLASVLQERINQGKEEVKNLKMITDICTKLKDSHIGYSELNAERYLKVIAEREDFFTRDTPYLYDRSSSVSYPIRRFVARMIDLSLYGLIWAAFSMLVLRMAPSQVVLRKFLDSYVSVGLMLLIEPLLLCTVGTTAGKFIFGLMVRNGEGGKLPWKAAWRRTWRLFVYGMGCGIPFYNYWRYYKSYKACTAREDLEWEYDCDYQIKDTSYLRIAAAAAVVAAYFALSFTLTLQAQMPRHRGELSRQELSANVNDLKSYLNIFPRYTFAQEGGWIKKQDPYYTVVIDVLNTELPQVQMEEKDGLVTAVSFEVEKRNEDSLIGNLNSIMDLLIIAYGGADKSINCIELFNGKNLRQDRNGQSFESFRYNLGEKEISFDIEYTGYDNVGMALAPREGEEKYVYMKFEIR